MKGTRWTHHKGGEYEILHFAVTEENLRPVVVYRAVGGVAIWTRPCTEFFDGRFKQGAIAAAKVAPEEWQGNVDGDLS